MRCGERWVSCGVSQVQTAESAGKKKANEPCAENFSPPLSPPEREPETAGSRAVTSVPFAGLVQEVTRWMGGEVIMVRSGESAESSESDEYESVTDESSGEK